MRLIKLLLIFIFSCVFSFTKAQDIHFSMFDLSPLTLNPANTGAFEGSFRIGGIYRDQWRSFLNNAYTTPSVYIDAPIVRGFGKNDWVGVGVSVLNDRAGSASLKNLTAMLSAAYHLALGPKANTYISLGVQGGIVQKSIDQTALTFGDQFQGGNFVGSSMDLSNIPEDNISYFDLQGGIVLNSNLTSRLNFNGGFSVFHIIQPEDAFLTNTSNDDKKLPIRYVANGTVNVDVGKRWIFSPMVLFQQQAKATEVAITGLAGYYLKTDKSIKLNFGAGYRLDDAVIARVGLDIKGLRAAVAYDFNTSDLNSASNGQGGFEIGLAYIAKIYRTPVVKPVLFCPRF